MPNFKKNPSAMSSPYKMKGHELPGPNQRSPIKFNRGNIADNTNMTPNQMYDQYKDNMGTSSMDWRGRGSASRWEDPYYGKPAIYLMAQRRAAREAAASSSGHSMIETSTTLPSTNTSAPISTPPPAQAGMGAVGGGVGDPNDPRNVDIKLTVNGKPV